MRYTYTKTSDEPVSVTTPAAARAETNPLRAARRDAPGGRGAGVDLPHAPDWKTASGDRDRE